MEGDRDRIQRLIEAFERSDWTEIDVRSGDIRVHLVADGHPPSSPTAAAPAIAESEPAPDPAPRPASTPAPVSGSAATVEPPDGAHVVSAPSPGIFWRAPEPGAPPFTEVGDEVSPDTTLCIIEVMKLMSHLKAGVAGTVVAVGADDGVAVSKDQALFAIDVSGS